jgi:hypothetical protein
MVFDEFDRKSVPLGALEDGQDITPVTLDVHLFWINVKHAKWRAAHSIGSR